MTNQEKQIDPSRIMQVGMGFWASKVVLTAINMHLFTLLSSDKLSAQQIGTKLGLHKRSLYDFLDALVALGFLQRTGFKEGAIYGNAEDADLFLDKNKPSYVGGILEMCNNRLFTFWNDLEEGLKTGEPQNESKRGGKSVFEEIYSDKEKTCEFLSAMAGIQMGNFIAFSQSFDFSPYKTLCDIGGAGGNLSSQIVLNNDHMQCTTLDLAPASQVATENIRQMDLSDRVAVRTGDFFKDDFPKADVITMGNILHDWGIEDKKRLIKKAYDALPEGGSLVIIENIIDDERKENVFALLMSLNMLIETEEGFDFSGRDFEQWAKECGFKETSVMPLTGPSSAAIAVK